MSIKKINNYMTACFQEFNLHLKVNQKIFLDHLLEGNYDIDNYTINYSSFDPLNQLIHMYNTWKKYTFPKMSKRFETEIIERIKKLMERKHVEIQIGMKSITTRNENSIRFHFRSTILKRIDDEIMKDKVKFEQDILLDPAIKGMAKEIYEVHLKIQDIKGYFEVFSILGDLLKEKNYSNEEVLEHCAEPIYHCRGCWLIESILNP